MCDRHYDCRTLGDHPARWRSRQGRTDSPPRRLSARGPARVERRETTVRRPQPARQVVLEPLDPGPRLQHLMGDVALGRAIVFGGRKPGGLNGNAAFRTRAIAIHAAVCTQDPGRRYDWSGSPAGLPRQSGRPLSRAPAPDRCTHARRRAASLTNDSCRERFAVPHHAPGRQWRHAPLPLQTTVWIGAVTSGLRHRARPNPRSFTGPLSRSWKCGHGRQAVEPRARSRSYGRGRRRIACLVRMGRLPGCRRRRSPLPGGGPRGSSRAREFGSSDLRPQLIRFAAGVERGRRPAARRARRTPRRRAGPADAWR